jgi:hypothetical protein
MLRALIVTLGIAMFLLWLVGLVDHSTDWIVWVDGVAALLTLCLVAATHDRLGPVGVALGPNLIGLGLVAVFIVGLVTGASAWIVWFNLAFGTGYLLFAAFAFFVRSVEPRMESRRPLAGM